jgi:putative N6-adenine-specific DNA methylase
MEIFVVCAEGIEPLLAEELVQLGHSRIQEGFRGVYVQTESFEAVYNINYCSRLAIRVLWPLRRFRCYDQKSIYKEVSAIDWFQYIPKGRTFAIDANVSHRSIRNSLFAAQVAKDAICDQFRDKTGSRPDVSTKNPDIQLNLYIRDDTGIMSFDTSGVPLHKRGYRLESGEAPIQETLAAALLTLAKYQGNEILCDPCCGSGTLLIEAALMASRTAPGYIRQNWGFMHLPEFLSEAWLKVKAEADRQRIPLPSGLLFGSDINKDMIRICKTNLRAAGFHQQVNILQSSFQDYTPPVPPNFIICNPPHGLRLEAPEQLVPLYRALGDFLKRKSSKPGRGFIFTGNLELAKEIGLQPKQRHVISNNGIDSRLLEFEIY